MVLGRLTPGHETSPGGMYQRRAGRGEKGSAAQGSGLRLSVHTCPPQTRRLRALIPRVHKQRCPGKPVAMPSVPVQDIDCRAGVAGVVRTGISGRRTVGLEAVQARQALVQYYRWLT